MNGRRAWASPEGAITGWNLRRWPAGTKVSSGRPAAGPGGADRSRRGRAGCPAGYQAACARPAAGVCAPPAAGRLEEGLARGLVLVCAPAAGGLAVTGCCGQRSGAVLAPRGRGGGPGIPPGIGELPGPLLGPLVPSSSDGLVTALINELAAAQAAEDEVVLVLDDYHLIDSQPVHAALLSWSSICRRAATGAGQPVRPAAAAGAAAGPAGSSRGGVLLSCASPRRRRRRRCCARRLARSCPARRWQHWRPAPRDGRPGCSWPHCRCGDGRTPPGSWRRSAAATATCWTT